MLNDIFKIVFASGVCSSSLFTNSNWFAFEDNRIASERSTGSLASPSPNTEGTIDISHGVDDEVIVGQDDDLVDTATSSSVTEKIPEEATVNDISDDLKETGPSESEKSPEWVEWRETSDSGDQSDVEKPSAILDTDQVKVDGPGDDDDPGTTVASLSSAEALADDVPGSNTSELPESGSGSENIKMAVVTEGADASLEHEKEKTVAEGGN